MKRFVFGVGFFCAASAFAGICEEKSKELTDQGKTVVSCKEVDFGVRAISSDFQMKQTEPVSVFPDKVRELNADGSPGKFVYVNEAPGIKNSLLNNPITDPGISPSALPHRGHSLLYKFTDALMKDQDRLRDDELMSWIKDEFRGLKSELTPEPRTAAWAGIVATHCNCGPAHLVPPNSAHCNCSC
jgi:hypothetical protein